MAEKPFLFMARSVTGELRVQAARFFARTAHRLLRVFSLLYAPGSPAEKVHLLLLSDLIWQASRANAFYGVGEMAERLAARVLRQSLCRR